MEKQPTEGLATNNGSIPADNSTREGAELKSTGPKFLIEPIYTEIVPGLKQPIVILDGRLQISKARLKEEKKKVKEALSSSIENGDELVFRSMTEGLVSSKNEGLARLGDEFDRAFYSKAPNLGSINVDLLTNGIAERNLIREGLKPQIAKQPFSFRDRNGRELSIEEDIEFVFAINSSDGGYKIIVGSKKGIDEIQVPIDLPADKFQPDFTRVNKNPVNDSIVIPIREAKDGTQPIATVFEIIKSPIDLIAALKKQEAEDPDIRQPRQRSQSTSSRHNPSSSHPYPPTYTPPPPQPPRRSSEGGGYGYVSGSR